MTSTASSDDATPAEAIPPATPQLGAALRPEVAELFRQVASTLLMDSAALVVTVAASSAEVKNPAVSKDPILQAEESGLAQAEVIHWLTSNVSRPGEPVAPFVGEQMVVYARDLQRRSLELDLAASWREGISAAWRRWMQVAIRASNDLDLVVDLLDVSLRSMLLFADASIRSIQDAILAESTHVASEARVLATIDLIMAEAPLSEAMLEARLGYRLGGSHVGAVVWHDGITGAGADLSSAVNAVAAAVGAPRHLVATASTAARWVWFATADLPGLPVLVRHLGPYPGVRVTVGRPASGLEGFRTTHRDAVSAHNVLTRTGSPHRAGSYADLALVDALTRDRASSEALVRETLGDLAAADRELRDTVLTYIRCGFSASKAAQQMYAHRNTVERRLARANEMSATRVDDDPVRVAAALSILELFEPH
ncbi:CdaR family transcriptional regulator [Williamsia sp. CHRR-6]|uniref:PucR family transcriptional regulator n=1 Tax=Williamsia sp. CHRR-6 TaxID=2835871 RepID=UPI001BD98DAD|nr:helix-turn-helix domain-containing protein [Williamsia sp. CHRR-6]MBT0566934.1 helix-turn-helix domain-containing protein [Williamsia sp. CHRR-6]